MKINKIIILLTVLLVSIATASALTAKTEGNLNVSGNITLPTQADNTSSRIFLKGKIGNNISVAEIYMGNPTSSNIDLNGQHLIVRFNRSVVAPPTSSPAFAITYWDRFPAYVAGLDQYLDTFMYVTGADYVPVAVGGIKGVNVDRMYFMYVSSQKRGEIFTDTGNIYIEPYNKTTIINGTLGVFGNINITGGNITISDILKLTPRTIAPTSPSEGWVYADDSHALCYYDSSAWVKLGGTGSCS